MILTLIVAIQNFHWKVWLVVYHQILSGCKRIISSEDIKRYIYISRNIYFDSPDQLISFEENIEVGGEI